MKSTHIAPLAGTFAPMLALACAAAPPPAGTSPRDMSEKEHLSAAAHEEGRASQPGHTHGQSCDPAESICWHSVPGKSRSELDAEEARKLAEQHRAAADALRQAEEVACEGLAAVDRDLSPFYHLNAIASAEKLDEIAGGDAAGAPAPEPIGVRVRFRSVPGLTRARLASLIECHLARAASVGFEMPEMEYCPLVIQGATAEVTGDDDALVVTVSGKNPSAAAAIMARAKELSP